MATGNVDADSLACRVIRSAATHNDHCVLAERMTSYEISHKSALQNYQYAVLWADVMLGEPTISELLPRMWEVCIPGCKVLRNDK
jgi:hypothetical protein